MTNKQLIEFCADKGIPLHETCKKLNWQGETFFFWCFDYSNSDWNICYYDLQAGSYKSITNNKSIICNDDVDENPEYVIPAPQIQEIAPLLPPKIYYITDSAEFFHINDNIGYDDDRDGLFEVQIKNFHFAQAYAELYIALREAGIINA